MRAILIDDEPFVLEYLERLCMMVPGLQVASIFTQAADALDWLSENSAELVITDIEMPALDGMSLAQELRQRHPGICVIFVTGYEQYALQAFRIEAAAYLTKPCTVQELTAAVQRAKKLSTTRVRVEVQTFGHFGVSVDGVPVRFSNSKAKELLALLIDRRGAAVTIEQAVATLWEDRPYDEMVKRLYRKAVAYLHQLFDGKGLDFFTSGRGSCQIVPAKVACDYYSLLDDSAEMFGRYNGEYLADYSWAEFTNGSIQSLVESREKRIAVAHSIETR